jgi:hypothetical protein
MINPIITATKISGVLRWDRSMVFFAVVKMPCLSLPAETKYKMRLLVNTFAKMI